MTKVETVRNGKLGKKELRLVKKDLTFYGLSDGVICVEGDHPDQVWLQLHDKAGKGDPKYFGFSGARNRFLKFFPNGFDSDDFVKQERDYKVAAKLKLDKTAPLEKALDGAGYGEAILSVFRATNMLSPFEKTRLQDVLRGPNADAFIQSAARFTKDGGQTNLTSMLQSLKPHDSGKWTVITYLPYLWRPEAHMFLKPEVTKDFATRVGHRLSADYEPRPILSVYESLLNLVAKTSIELENLKPRDGIDIQSFIWVVGDYKEGREEPKI